MVQPLIKSAIGISGARQKETRSILLIQEAAIERVYLIIRNSCRVIEAWVVTKLQDKAGSLERGRRHRQPAFGPRLKQHMHDYRRDDDRTAYDRPTRGTLA